MEEPMTPARTPHSPEYISLREYFEALLLAEDRAIDTRLKAMDKATDAARQTMELRLNSMNEFRDTLRDQAMQFITKAEYHQAMDRLNLDLDIMRDQSKIYFTRPEHELFLQRVEADIRILRESKATLEGKANQSSMNVALVMSAMGLILAILGLLLKMVGVV
jgi:hypothetical protein